MAAVDDIKSSLDLSQIAQYLGTDEQTANEAVDQALAQLVGAILGALALFILMHGWDGFEAEGHMGQNSYGDAGSGYAWWAEQVLALDALNPQVSARLARALDAWARLAEPYRSAAGQAIERIAAQPTLSPDLREVITRALATASATPQHGA